MQMKPFNLIIFLVITGAILFFVPHAYASENSCIDCHRTVSPFQDIQKQFNQVRIQHLEKNVTCSLECHEDRLRQLATANYQQWSNSLHALKGVTCEICHEGDPKQTVKEKAHLGIKKPTDLDSPVYYTNVPKTCGNCHSKELANFANSKHYQRLEALKLAPTCTTCHAPHTFMVLNPEEFRNFCGNCHSVYKKVAPYDVPVQAEYLLGKVNKLKFNIEITRQDIFWAKKNGTDVAAAERYTDDALSIMQNLPPMWHEFNLTHFEDEIDSAGKELKKAQDIIKPAVTPTRTPAPRTPGFIFLSGIVSLLAAVYLIRRK